MRWAEDAASAVPSSGTSQPPAAKIQALVVKATSLSPVYPNSSWLTQALALRTEGCSGGNTT